MKIFNQIDFKSESLKQISEKCLDKGYKVFIFQDTNISQVFISDKQDNICTVSCCLGGLNVSTVHKPNRDCGTGFRVHDDLYQLSVNQIDTACNMIVPLWAPGSFKHVKKWKSMTEKINSCSVLTYHEIIL